MNMIRFAGAGLALFAGLWAVATEPSVAGRLYTFADCLALARARNGQLANARRDEEIAAARITQVRAQALPELKATAAYTRLDEAPSMDFNGQRMDLGREDNYSAGVEISQLLYSGGSVRAALRAAGDYQEVASLETAREEARLARDLRIAYADVLLASHALAVRRQSVAQLEAFVTQVEQRHAQALVSDFERNSARVRLANERPRVIAAQGALILARARLAHLARIEESDFEIADDLAEGAADHIALGAALDEARARRPELAQARRLVDLRAADVRHTQGRYFPQLRARAAYNGVNPPSGALSDEWDWGWNAGLTVEWALFDGALREGDVTEKRLTLAKAEENVEELARLIRLEVETAHAEWLTACEAVLATAQTADLAASNLAIARTRYDAGLATQLEFSDAQLALSTAQLGHYEALAGRARASAALDFARGRPVADGEGRMP